MEERKRFPFWEAHETVKEANKKIVEETPSKGIVQKNAVMRLYPNGMASRVKILKEGTEVQIKLETKDLDDEIWYALEGEIGYIHSKFIAFE